MFFSKQDYEHLLGSLSKKFNLYSFIDNNYLKNMLDSLMNTGSFEELKLVPEEMSKDMNPLFHISFKIQNYLYYKICKLSEDDIEVLLNLVEDKRRVVNLIFRKLKVEDDSKIDDYIMNLASLYNGVESFDSFVTRYVMSAIKGVSFEVEKSITVPVTTTLEDVSDKKKKKKDKKKKDKKKSEKTNVDVSVTSLNKSGSEDISVNTLIDASVVEISSNEVSLVESVSEVEAVFDEVVSVNEGLVIDVIPEKTLYEVVLEKCNSNLGRGIKDSFISMILLSDLVNSVSNIEDEKYKMYFLLRFGLMNSSFYTREEISSILEIDLLNVIEYERYTINKLREFMNRVVNQYEEYILKK